MPGYVERLPVVDQAAFDDIECNRCGACCESFSFITPVQAIKYMRGIRTMANIYPQDSRAWLLQLTPTYRTKPDGDGYFTWGCGHFARDDEGRGLCTIHETRPTMCADFPYGRPVNGAAERDDGSDRAWLKCSWNVTLFDFEPLLDSGIESQVYTSGVVNDAASPGGNY